MKTNAVLPEHEVERLRKLRTLDNPAELRARVLALRRKRWPLRAIGEALDVTRMGVRSWVLAAEEDPEIVNRSRQITDVPPLPLTARGSGVSIKRVYPRVPEPDLERMKELAPQVRTIRGSTPKDHPSREAAREYSDLLDLYINKRKVPAQHVARAVGVTRRAIVARLEQRERDAAKVGAR